ncbi:MAG: acetyl-CoA C-acetyltransferase, partial [Pseudomonadales bacterium]
MTLTGLQDNDVVIVSATRTPIGAFQGVFSTMAATELGAASIRAAIGRAGLDA